MPMASLLLAVLAALLIPAADAQAQPAPRFERRTMTAPDGTAMRYGLAVPGGYQAARPRPLVVALHPGGSSPYYGDGFLRSIFLPGLRALDPIMVAPDVPGRSWAEPGSERAVLALVEAMTAEFAVDRRRILIVGFSMGAAGTWYMAARHGDRFTAAIVLAGRTEEPVASLAKIPTYIIHSQADEVVPFDQAQARAAALERLGRPVRFEALTGVSHFDMGAYVDALGRAGEWVTERWRR